MPSGGRRASLSPSQAGAFVDATLVVATGDAPRRATNPMQDHTDADDDTEMVELTIEPVSTETVELDIHVIDELPAPGARE